MATIRRVYKLPKRNARSLYKVIDFTGTDFTWTMAYYNPEMRKKIKKAKKLAKRNKIYNNHY